MMMMMIMAKHIPVDNPHFYSVRKLPRTHNYACRQTWLSRNSTTSQKYTHDDDNVFKFAKRSVHQHSATVSVFGSVSFGYIEIHGRQWSVQRFVCGVSFSLRCGIEAFRAFAQSLCLARCPSDILKFSVSLLLLCALQGLDPMPCSGFVTLPRARFGSLCGLTRFTSKIPLWFSFAHVCVSVCGCVCVWVLKACAGLASHVAHYLAASCCATCVKRVVAGTSFLATFFAVCIQFIAGTGVNAL